MTDSDTHEEPTGQLIADGQLFVESSERFHQIATAITGKSDFGDAEYRDGLGILLRSLDEEAELSPSGRQSLAGIVVTALCGRLSSEAHWESMACDPGPAFSPDPIVIVGLPRTGTSALHRLLCGDPRHQGLELWLGQAPKPRPPRADWAKDGDYQRAESGLRQLFAASPEMAKIHTMAADAPDECWNLMRQSFSTVTFECVAHVPSYSDWWAQGDATAAYQRWARNLLMISSHEPEKRWILKDPSHLFAPETLLRVVPNALVVMTHRDPARAIPSVCSLNASARVAHEQHTDLRVLGAEQNALWARGMKKFMNARDRYPDRFMDLHFEEFTRDPGAGVEAIYERIGSSVPARIRQDLAGEQAEASAFKHDYDAARFGLDPKKIRADFREYMDAFGVRAET